MIAKLTLILALGLFPTLAQSAGELPAIEAALQAAGENRTELTKALSEVPSEQRDGMRFLIENMPPVDLARLDAGFLLAHVDRSYQAMAAAPWSKRVPQEIFFNDVLAYSCVNERRDDGRAKLARIAAPLVKDCKTPGEAALVLNRELFGIVNVKYSTERKKPDQSALESMESGLATCTGLSILLADACRAVGVPARIVGTPLWTNLRGNHTWVEIWDGEWHFLGAAEPDAKGLNHGWFKHDAATADDAKPEHRIYASSFKRTGLAFPLVWAPSIDWVSAVNVTARYAGNVKPEGDRVKLLVRVVDQPQGARVAAKVTVTDPADATQTFSGTSSGATSDLNNFLTFALRPNRLYRLVVERASIMVKQDVMLTQDAEQTVSVTLAERSEKNPVSGGNVKDPRVAELDTFWAEVSRSVREGDFDAYAATCHPEGVLVSGIKKSSSPLSEALARWKKEFVATKSGEMKASVDFRFSQRLGDATTAHDEGIFLYSSSGPDGVITQEYIHFEVLLVKREGRWLTLMEYQKSKATLQEWEALKDDR